MPRDALRNNLTNFIHNYLSNPANKLINQPTDKPRVKYKDIVEGDYEQ